MNFNPDLYKIKHDFTPPLLLKAGICEQSSNYDISPIPAMLMLQRSI